MFLLGQCEAFVKAIVNTGILPHYYKKLMNISLTKGVQATTAIEGNSLSLEDVEKIAKGESLKPSQEYQGIEVKNIVEAYNTILKDVVIDKKVSLLTPTFIKKQHKAISRDLDKYMDAIPGQFRSNNAHVGTYRCPEYIDVDELMGEYCKFMKDKFHYAKGQEIHEAIIQAIVAHVYLEWIHPFGDGNGRTGRLLEYYILLRGKIPNIASHILSSHYNSTRPQYYAELSNATAKRSLTDFIEYALLGFRDGLETTLNTIQKSQLEITWQKYVYDQFTSKLISKTTTKVFKRQRRLALEMPYDKWIDKNELLFGSSRTADRYIGLSMRTIDRDISILTELNLLMYNSMTMKYKTRNDSIQRMLAMQL